MRVLEKELMHVLKKEFTNNRGKNVILEWDDGTILSAEIIGVFKTENFLDKKDPNYEEFLVCSFLIRCVYNSPKDLDSKYIGPIMVGSLAQVSYHNAPHIIKNYKGDIIWNYSDSIEYKYNIV